MLNANCVILKVNVKSVKSNPFSQLTTFKLGIFPYLPVIQLHVQQLLLE
jgi:hypothetical protein